MYILLCLIKEDILPPINPWEKKLNATGDGNN